MRTSFYDYNYSLNISLLMIEYLMKLSFKSSLYDVLHNSIDKLTHIKTAYDILHGISYFQKLVLTNYMLN